MTREARHHHRKISPGYQEPVTVSLARPGILIHSQNLAGRLPLACSDSSTPSRLPITVTNSPPSTPAARGGPAGGAASSSFWRALRGEATRVYHMPQEPH